MSDTIVTAEALSRHYEVKGGFMQPPRVVKALSEASFTLTPGRTLAVVGESGCGKSTLARLITMIEEPTAGSLEIDGVEATIDNWPQLRHSVQIIFQDPYGSLNPRHRIGTILEEPLRINHPEMGREAITAKAREMAERVLRDDGSEISEDAVINASDPDLDAPEAENAKAGDDDPRPDTRP